MLTDVVHRISLVVPVYCGEKTLSTLIQEIAPLTKEQITPNGNRFVICDLLLVHDCGPDRSDKAIEALVHQYAFVQPIWLSRNYGQHAATLAGMASATGEWVVTIDEDGQQNPFDIRAMLDCALGSSLQLVYAKPINPPPHGWLAGSGDSNREASGCKAHETSVFSKTETDKICRHV